MQDEPHIQDYLSGRLSAAEAAAFEARMFEDDELAAEVQQALEIRAALQEKVASPRVTVRRGNWAPRPAWALAAAIVLVGIGIVWFRPEVPSTPVFRGVEQTMGLEVEVTGGKLNAHWAAASGAQGYELQTFDADGQLLDSVPSMDTTVAIELHEAVPPAYAEVVALDDFGQTLLRSQRVQLAPDGR